MKHLVFVFLLLIALAAHGQLPDHIYKPNIHSIKLYKAGDPFSYPVIKLNSGEELELYFDDLDANVKNYYYSYQLCNADWSPAALRTFDYIKGFQNVRITNYRNSSIAFTRYINYQARVPDRNCTPTRSGNYLLKIFLDGDTTKLVFTKRFLVVETKASVAAQILQPFNASIFRTHQKLQVAVNFTPQINVFNQQDVKITLLQNNIWSSALYPLRPNIFRGNYLEYNDESFTAFPAGKEWRWIDLRSLRLMSERMTRIDKQPARTDVFVKPDGERGLQAYLFYRDVNGLFTIETTDNVNPLWQTDYAYVHFSFYPPGNKPYPGRNVHLFGELVNYTLDENSKMEFNEEKGAYEKILLLKQGFYNYSYVTTDGSGEKTIFTYENTEGNYWGTENAYTILVYYRPFGGRADELIGFTTLNSIFQRPGGF
jgi:hypothetical protein